VGKKLELSREKSWKKAGKKLEKNREKSSIIAGKKAV